MSDSSVSPHAGQGQARFVGGYVNDMVQVLTASALSRQNTILIGAPGWGKTEIARRLAYHLTGGRYVFIALDPSTPPDRINGFEDPVAFSQGRIEMVLKDTPYDPQARLVLLDEIGRPNDVVFDALLHVCSRKDKADAPPVWGTANFMPATERTEALIDRFPLWFWVKPGSLDIYQLVEAHANGDPDIDASGLPTWDEIRDIWATPVTAKAKRAVADLLHELKNEAETNGRKVHPRRAAQWTHLLTKTAIWFGGSADFSVVPDKATRLLRYAWPALSAQESESWAQIAGSVVDAVGAAIEATMAQVVNKMNEIAALPDGQRASKVMELGTLMQGAQESLEKLAGPDDDRVQEAIGRMNKWLGRAIQGQTIDD